jgi:hypothetical protein
VTTAPALHNAHLRTRAIAVALVFYIAFVWFLVANSVNGTVLSPGFYNTALDDNRVYDRFYSEVLADPALKSTTQDLLGGGDIDEERAAAVSILRTVLPPATLKTVTESTITALIAYLRGDAKRIDTRVDLDSVLNNLSKVAGQSAANLLASAQDDSPDSLDAFSALLQQFVLDLQNGSIPATIPTVDASSDTAQFIIDFLFGRGGITPSPLVRTQVEAALAAGDTRGALIVAASGISQSLAQNSVTRLQTRLQNGRYLDPLTAISQIAGRPESDVLQRFNSVRDDIEVFPTESRYLAIVIMALCVGYVARITPGGRSNRLRLVGRLLLSTGIAAVLTVVLFARLIERPIVDSLSSSGLGDAPPSVAKLVLDVSDSLQIELHRSMLHPALLVAAIGLVAVIASFAPRTYVAHLRVVERNVLRSTRGRIALGALAAIVIAVGAWQYIAWSQRGPRLCNGHAELCKRPLNQVTFAATHNSMSAAADGWLFPDQDYGIATQLQSGVRGLLIDTHYWQNESDIASAAGEAAVPGGLGGSVARLLSGLGQPVPGPLLCHELCVLGSQPLAAGLGEIKSFLDQNRNEVIVILIEDYITSADTAKAFAESGLNRYVYSHRPGTRWPALRQMIKDNHRVVVFVENGGAPPAWYEHAWTSGLQDTSYSVASADSFNCTLNRGNANNELLLMNHWIDKLSPDRLDATTVNNYDALMAHANQCIAQRHRKPNLIAVDFYSIGDLLKAVDTLNGVK